MCLDVDDSLWIADSGGHPVIRIDAHGQLLDTIECGDYTAYAVALGGEDNRSLYLCIGPKFGTYDPRVERRGQR